MSSFRHWYLVWAFSGLEFLLDTNTLKASKRESLLQMPPLLLKRHVSQLALNPMKPWPSSRSRPLRELHLVIDNTA